MSDQPPQSSSAGMLPEQFHSKGVDTVSTNGGTAKLAPNWAPVNWLEFGVLCLLIVLTDLTLYQGNGYAALSALFGAGTVLLLLGSPQRHITQQTLVILLLVFAAAVRLVWCGNPLAVVTGAALLVGVSSTLAGGTVHVFDLLQFALLLLRSGAEGLKAYEQRFRSIARTLLGNNLTAVVLVYLLPLFAAVVFSTIFVMANPDVVSLINRELSSWIENLRNWCERIVVEPSRIVLWTAATWLGIGLLRPLVPERARDVLPAFAGTTANKAPRNELYLAIRNTILTVVVVFAGYLVFEFTTMWFRTFPPKFHYSGYAHEGAAWLTVALGLATLILSAIFRGSFMRDARMPFVRKLAMVWAAENILLALAVYNRLAIYIQFNGMTQMRVVGLLGITAVVIGFGLVVWKVWHARSFAWLIRSQLLALACAIYLFAILPVDLFVNWYNVRQVLAGNPAASVQIAHHATSSEGKLMWFPLLKCSDPIIRDGIAEMLADTKRKLISNPPATWHAYQHADTWLKQAFDHPDNTIPDGTAGSGAAVAFKSYSYQWY